MTINMEQTMDITDLRGIDISSWQKGMSAEAFNSVDFAILKISEGKGWNDPCFDTFYNMAKIPLGAYVFSYATTENAAIEEAKHAIDLAKGRKLPLGIYIDVEDPKQLALRDSELTAVVKAFCDTVKAAGYRAGAYGSAGQLWAKVGPKYVGDDVIVWVAQWGGRPKMGDLWQFSATDRIDGYSSNVDGDKVISERFAQMVVGAHAEPIEPPMTTPLQHGKTCSVTVELPILRFGDKGYHVKMMQTALIAKGYSCGWMGADGWFGEQTKIALHEWQKKNGIMDKDVVCRSESWITLLEV